MTIRIEVLTGQAALDDPQWGLAARAVAKHNCSRTLDLHRDRLPYLVERLQLHGADTYAIVILNVDDPHGGPMTEQLMPGHDWSAERSQGMVPFARGLVHREWLFGVLETFDAPASQKLRETPGTSIVVVDHGVADVFSWV